LTLSYRSHQNMIVVVGAGIMGLTVALRFLGEKHAAGN
jgi:glycine/D-amino acid oxidase-like deaminating enzyme